MKTRVDLLVCAGFALGLLASCGYGPPAQMVAPGETDFESTVALRGACAPERRALIQKPEDVISETGRRTVDVIHGGIAKKIETNFAIGSDCIDRPLKEVWGVLHNPAALQWDESTLRSLEKVPLAEGETFHFRTFQAANALFSPSWYIDWIHYLKLGTIEDPERVQVEFLKTRGTSFIAHWSGQLVLEAQGTSTAAYMSIELEGTSISTRNCRGAITSQLKRMREKPAVFDHFE